MYSGIRMHSVEIILLDSIFAAYDKCYVKYFKRNNITNKNTVLQNLTLQKYI